MKYRFPKEISFGILLQKQDKTMKKPELLAPAGSIEKVKIAYAYGADAVYAGLPMFSLRTKENKFDLENLKQAIKYSHENDKKIYVTANIYAHNIKIEPFLEAMDTVIPFNADAYIMSDPGLISLIKEKYPDIVIHLSTQANNTNWAQVKFWEKQGVKRIILARELNLEEINEIVTKNPEMELEVFVHGALCVSYSGRCLLSDYMTNRASNYGRCSQACRFKYRTYNSFQEKDNDYTEPEALYVEEEFRENEKLKVTEDEFGTYIFNSRDLCSIELIPKIIQTGVHSLKIEGRNKNLLYLATVTRIYRDAIDSYFDGSFYDKLESWKKELETINRRGFIKGFFEGYISDSINYQKKEDAQYEFGGVYVQRKTDKVIEIKIKHKIQKNDEIEWFIPNKGIISQKLNKIYDNYFHEIEEVSAGNLWNPLIESDIELNTECLFRIKNKNYDNSLIK